MQAGRREDREDGRGALGVRVAPVEHAIGAIDDDFSYRTLHARVVERQLAVVEHATKLSFLVDGVADGAGRKVASLSRGARLFDPLKEAIDERAYVLIAHRFALSRW